MTVLVTGGTGLVGPRLLRRLVGAGIACRGLVRAGKELPDGVERADGDLTDDRALDRAVSGVSAVVHLAAVFRTQDEHAIWAANLEGTKSLLAAVQRASAGARFVFASTGNVYAHDLDRPAREDDRTTTENAYAASKVAAEAEVRGSGLTWIVLRLPFVYGDGDGHLEAMSSLMARMSAHPAQRYSVAHHQDVATAVQLALTGVMDGRTVNIADDASLSIYEMIALAGGECPPSAAPLANPWSGQMDTGLARSLGFIPKISTAYQAQRDGLL
jgi:nucleoside-diphosphate-sugar epimerase